MRHLLAFVLMIALVGSAAAVDLGTVSKDIKTNDHVGMNPGTPDGREGGEDMATAVAVTALPYGDTGNTTDNINDYDAVCPYSGSTSPDVVYSFTPATDMLLSCDLLGSTYDTKIYVMDGDMNLIDCNDDFHPGYVSFIEAAPLSGGIEYFIIVDGYGGDAGDYVLTLTEFIAAPPCILTCDGLAEGEPTLVDGYEDAFNGGCNSPEFGNPFLDLTAAADENGELALCGVSGWYNENTTRDTDWMYVQFGELGMIEWTLDAELPVYGFLLGGDCDSGPTVDEQITAGPCTPATLVLQGNPGDVIMLWVGPTEYGGPAGNQEFNYVGDFTGLMPGVVATDNVSFDGIKSLYR